MRNKMKNCDLWDRIAADMIDLERRAGGHGKDLQTTVILKLVLASFIHQRTFASRSDLGAYAFGRVDGRV